MQARYRLKKSYQYNYVYSHSKSVGDRHIVLLYCTTKGGSRVGFSVGKKHGNAVARNRLRRQLKAVTAQYMPAIKNGYNIIVVPRQTTEYNYNTLINSIGALLVKAGLTNDK